MSTDVRPAPRLSTLAEVDAAIIRDEALLARYRLELAELEAEEEATVRARELVSFVERRKSRILARMTEHERSPLLSGELSWNQLTRGD